MKVGGVTVREVACALLPLAVLGAVQVAHYNQAVVVCGVNRLRSSYSFVTAAFRHRRAFVSVAGLRYGAMEPRMPCNRQGRGGARLNSWA